MPSICDCLADGLLIWHGTHYAHRMSNAVAFTVLLPPSTQSPSRRPAPCPVTGSVSCTSSTNSLGFDTLGELEALLRRRERGDVMRITRAIAEMPCEMSSPGEGQTLPSSNRWARKM